MAEKAKEEYIEEKRNMEIAKNLLDNKISIDIIMKSTGLTKEEIESLK